MDFNEFFKELGACVAAKEWVQVELLTKTPQETYEACTRMS